MSDIQQANLYGMREPKYDWLSTHDVNYTDCKKIEPQNTISIFITQENQLSSYYKNGCKIKDV
ncbi:MAG: hypothetical protein ACK5QB_03165, partial [Pseudanabaena sp.]